jgi:ribosomal protein L7/L12
VALSDSFRVIGGNARISNAYVTNWTNPTSASLEALAKSVGGKLFINGMSGEGEPIQLNSSTTKASELRIQNANREVRLTGGAGQNFALYVTDASVGFSENFMAGAMNMPNISVSGNSKLTFMSADALLKWLYVWKPQNPGANVTMAVATDDPSKQSVAAMVNAAIAGGMVDVDKMSKQTVLTNINNFVNNGTIPAGDAYKDVLKEVAGDLFQSLYTPAGEYSVRLTSAPKNTVVYTVLREVLDCTLAEAREYQATAPCDLVSGVTQNAATGIKNDLDAKFNAKGIDVVVEVVKGTTSSGAGTTETTGATDTTGTTTDATAGTTTDTTTDANAGTTSDTADVPSRVTTTTSPSTTTRTLVSYTYNVGLANIGASKLAVIKVVKEQLGLTLSNAKTLVESAPCVLATGVTKAQADSLKALLEEAGATVVLNAVSSSGTTSTSVTTPRRISL